ncbi:energy-coupling factor transporter transmembrane protein EcfT [Gordonia sp. PDNC005]|jgi:energy-coupling factor transport system permease protein|uniref:energy-coupling factor transporter transmembrane component T family protein n=1 Tax=unclassified Gordonia (in: high G+C Gram-positive bacteria) TaxID=2657482 RepID=UPI0019655243|nr:energy-coupling factor transporter transmembrane protein EcfT [Gordonia sp. PDNC005]QRY62444.1 energy-coupling factor transporter transmembrane protein EcfT [Gordonia sp. PDNC005]
MQIPMLRQIPGDSVVHRLWAGTKLLIVLTLGLMTWILPSWPALGYVAVCMIVFALLAGIPVGALPRPPWWFWAVMAVGVAWSWIARGNDGGLTALRAVLLGLVVLAMSVLVVWTTPVAELAPAIAVLMRPLKLLRLPVDEWAVTIALSLRGLPLLIDEMRLLWAAHRLRPKSSASSGHPSAEPSILDMIVAAMSSAMRRSAEMSEAITARGGTGRLTAYPSRPGRLDAIVLTVFVLLSVGAATTAIILL